MRTITAKRAGSEGCSRGGGTVQVPGLDCGMRLAGRVALLEMQRQE